MKETHEIDDLLKIVSSELIAGYEAMNLDGKTLSEVNDNLKEIKAKEKKAIASASALFMGLFVGSIVYLSLFGGRIAYVIPVFLLSLVLIRSVFDRILSRYENDLKEHEYIFRKFRESAEALNPLSVSTTELNESSVYHTLVVLAGRKLDAEIRYKRVCQRGVSPREMIPVANALLECEKQFEETMKVADRFNERYPVAMLFHEAEKRMLAET